MPLWGSIQEYQGSHFSVKVAPVGFGRTMDNRSWRAFFFPDPDCETTYIGAGVYQALGGARVFKNPKKTYVYFSIRNKAGVEQMDIGIRVALIEFSPKLPRTWIRFGYKTLLEYFQMPEEFQDESYFGLQKLGEVSLIWRPGREPVHKLGCYPINPRNADAIEQRRPMSSML